VQGEEEVEDPYITMESLVLIRSEQREGLSETEPLGSFLKGRDTMEGMEVDCWEWVEEVGVGSMEAPPCHRSLPVSWVEMELMVVEEAGPVEGIIPQITSSLLEETEEME
jgi:hypothetical protein